MTGRHDYSQEVRRAARLPEPSSDDLWPLGTSTDGDGPPVTRDAKPVAGAITLVTAANLATPLLGAATAPLLARGLGVVGRGDVAAATAPMFLAVAVGTLGLTDAIIQRVAPDGSVNRSVVWRVMGALLASGVLLTACSALVAPILSPDRPEIQRYMVVATAFIIPALQLAVFRSLVQALGLWGYIAAEQAVTSVLRFALVLSLFATGNLTVFSAVLATAIPLVVSGVVYISLGSRIRSWMRSGPHRFGQLVGFGSRMWIGYLGGVLLTRIDQLIMVPLADAEALGLYVVAVTIAELLLVITNTVRDVTFASDAARPDNGRAAAVSRVSTLMCLGATGVTAAIGPSAIPLIFGRQFENVMPTVILLMIATVILAPGSVAGAVLISRGYPGRRSISLAIAALINIATLFILVPTRGALGAAIAMIVGNLVFATLNLVLLGRVTSVRPRDFFGLRISDIAALRGLRIRNPA